MPRALAILRAAVHVLCAVPMAWLALDTARGALGPDPVAALTDRSGIWALRILLLALAVTPVRRWLRRPELVQLRRPLGLWAFAYATAHFSIWLLDLQGFWSQALADIAKRPFITVGFAAWLLLVPLAATSTRAMMRRLGRRWASLHRLVYAIGALGVLHFWWGVKSGEQIARLEPVVYAVILSVLLLARLPWRRWGVAIARRSG
jgi:methionine sulfoxide reductase heme-binding subunit